MGGEPCLRPSWSWLRQRAHCSLETRPLRCFLAPCPCVAGSTLVRNAPAVSLACAAPAVSRTASSFDESSADRPRRPHRRRPRANDRLLRACARHDGRHVRRGPPRPRVRRSEAEPPPRRPRIRAEGAQAHARRDRSVFHDRRSARRRRGAPALAVGGDRARSRRQDRSARGEVSSMRRTMSQLMATIRMGIALL